jgi:hypothetical protein
MDVAKLALSEEELRLVMDPGVILTKNAIIRKVYFLFGELSEIMSRDLILPAEVTTILPKISKGESYQGLPYVMLDHPRYFTAEHVLAIRTFFWWGNFFSVTLHLKGKYQLMYGRSLANQFEKLAAKQYSIAICESEWQHHTGTEDYISLQGMGPGEFEGIIRTHPFVKLSRTIPLEQWDDMHYQLRNAQEELGIIIGLRVG